MLADANREFREFRKFREFSDFFLKLLKFLNLLNTETTDTLTEMTDGRNTMVFVRPSLRYGCRYGLLIYLCPGVFEGHCAVEDKVVGSGVRIRAEVADALELQVVKRLAISKELLNIALCKHRE